MLGLGRAIGETIAVTLVIGNAPTIGKHLFDQGYTLAAVIANEFGEAANKPLHRAALIAAGLVLFVLTLIVNAGARYMVRRASRGTGSRPDPRSTCPCDPARSCLRDCSERILPADAVPAPTPARIVTR